MCKLEVLHECAAPFNVLSGESIWASCEHTLHRAKMSLEMLGKFNALGTLLPEFDVAISRSGDQELSLSGHHSMRDSVSMHVAALIHIC